MEGLARKPEKIFKELMLDDSWVNPPLMHVNPPLMHYRVLTPAVFYGKSRVLKHNSGKEKMEGLAVKRLETKASNRSRMFELDLDVHLREISNPLSVPLSLNTIDMWNRVIRNVRTKEDKRLKDNAEKLKTAIKLLSQKIELEPQVGETAEYFAKMTEETLEQKARLTKSFLKETRKGSRVIQTTTCHPELANNSASLKDICCDVRKYVQQISISVQEKICSLPDEVREKLESVIVSFQRLIVGMWKLLLCDLLLHEMTSLFATDQRDESTISRKKGRFKYGFQMASMMALWLAHDVESNPGPSFTIRSSLERIARDLSEVLRYHLPVDGSLWSESVAAAAYAAGYSTDCQWSNPSGNKKDKLMTLIERATELGRVLTTLDCLPTELAPFVNDLANYAIQEQLVVYYKMNNLRSAVDIVLGISSLGDEQNQTIIHEIQRLKQISEVPHSSKRPTDAGRMCTTTDFEQLADSTTSRPNVSLQKKMKRRKPKRFRHTNEQGNHFDNLDKSQNSAVPEQEAAVTLGQQMDPGSDGKNDTNIVVNLNETLSAASKVQEVTVQENIATKSMSARNTDRTSTSDENQTFSVGTKESEPLCSTGEAISILNEIFDSNIINQLHDIEFDDILVWPDGTETQVQNVMDDDTISKYMPRTATNDPVMTQLQVTVANISNSGSIPTGQGHEKNMNINPDVTEIDKESDSTLQGNTGQGGTTDYLDRDRDSLTQDREEAEEHRIGDDDSVENTGDGQQLDKTKSKTELLQQTLTLQATGSNSGLETARNESTSVDRGSIKETMDDTYENEAETLSSGEQQFADAEMETEPTQQTLPSMTAVTSSYPDTDIDEMYKEETVDDNTPGTRENEIEDLNLGTEQFASTEPSNTQTQRMESTVCELFAKLKASLLKEVDARLESFKATLENNTPHEHVMNNNGQPLGCALSDVEHTEPRVGSSNSSRKRNLTDPEDGSTSKKWRQ